MRSSRGVLVAFVAALVPLTVTATASAAGTLDQQQNAGPNCGFFDTSAQVFTAGLSGDLDQIDLGVYKPFSGSGTVSVELRSTANGAPTSNVLASTSASTGGLPMSEGTWMSFIFATPATVQAGAQYAVVATYPASDTQLCFSLDALYAGGSSFHSTTTPPAFEERPGSDYQFRTYVVVPPPDCADGIDNDSDGLIDYPLDLGCSSAADGSEGPSATTISVTGTTSPRYGMRATLRDNDGAPVTGQTIVFRSGGMIVCTAITDSSGIASCFANTRDKRIIGFINTRGFDATFAGTTDLLATSGHGSFGVAKPSAGLTKAKPAA